MFDNNSTPETDCSLESWGKIVKRIITTVLAAGALAVGMPAAANADTVQTDTVSPAFTCASGYYAFHVTNSDDFLKVHKSPNSAAVPGQIPGGNQVCINTFGLTLIGGHYWDHGYGYNGSIKVTGYMADDHIV
jgi:hypothetical protein